MSYGYKDPETLQRLHYEEGQDIADIAEKFGGVPDDLIAHQFKVHELTIRPDDPYRDNMTTNTDSTDESTETKQETEEPSDDSNKKTPEEILEKFRNRVGDEQVAEAQEILDEGRPKGGLPTDECLYELHTKRGLFQTEIGALMGVGGATISGLVKVAGVAQPWNDPEFLLEQIEAGNDIKKLHAKYNWPVKWKSVEQEIEKLERSYEVTKAQAITMAWEWANHEDTPELEEKELREFLKQIDIDDAEKEVEDFIKGQNKAIADGGEGENQTGDEDEE